MGIVTVTDAKIHMNMSADMSHDAEIQGFVDAATPVIEDIVGPVTPTDFDEWYDGGGPTIVLRHYPVVAITAVTEYAGAAPTILDDAASPDVITGSSYTFDADTGIIYRARTWGASLFANGSRNIRVQYQAGRAAVPPNIRLATLELIRHLYQLSQQGGRPSLGGAAGEEGPWAPSGFAVPTRVIELLAPDRRSPTLA